MAYFVDRVVICDAYAPPGLHYEILPGGRSRLVAGRRPSKRYLVGGREAKGGIGAIVGPAPGLFDDEAEAANEVRNEFVNELREKVAAWREGGYTLPAPALVTRRLLEWWFERDEERRAVGRRIFFCQREAIETLIYLYECEGRRRLPETGSLVRYAVKMATGTGKTNLMALLVVWSTLHRRKVSGSTLSANFLVLVPNLTVRSRVSGRPRGDGLDPGGEHNIYDAFDLVPPEYKEEFRPNVLVRNWQSIPLEARREDWIPEESLEAGRFVPQAVLRAMKRRAGQDPDNVIRREISGWRDLLVLNDEAHHVYGEKRARAGEEPEFIKWSRILDRIAKAARVGLVVDLSATPWYGSGSAKPEGTLFEWLVSDFSVYDAFESGLVKVVRLPDPDEAGRKYLDLWDDVRGARTEHEYVMSGKGAIASLYSSWKHDWDDWSSSFEFARGPSPVLLCVTDNATRARWLFDHLTKEYELLKNPDDEDPRSWKTIQIDSKVFDADKGREAVIREMVDTVGKKGAPGEHVRAIVSVNMLSEGWDVKSVTHILGLRAFGSPLLTEQVIGRGLRRTSYDVLNQPLEERPAGSDETVDAFGIPFVGFPVERRKRPASGGWNREKPRTIEPEPKKADKALRVPNVRAWAVGVTGTLSETVRVAELPQLTIDPRKTPPEVTVRPVVGGQPEAVLTLESFRDEWPLLKTTFLLAQELFEATNPDSARELNVGPTFEELLEVVRDYLRSRLKVLPGADERDTGIYYWRVQAKDALETAIRAAGRVGTRPVPIPGKPEWLDSGKVRKFQWTGVIANGKKAPTNRVPCHTDLEREFADFLDAAPDVLRYLKNERFGFSVTYYEGGRPRQYYPDFIVQVREPGGRDVMWVAETKGEIRPNTPLKEEAARLWCDRMSKTQHGPWRHLFVPQRRFESAMASKVATFAGLAEALASPKGGRPHLSLVPLEEDRVAAERFRTLLPLYSLRAAAGVFGEGEAVEPEGWLDATSIGRLDERMFVVRAAGRSMEPRIHDGDFLVFRRDPQGTRKGEIVLARYRGAADPETGGAFTVKRYESEKVSDAQGGWRHVRIVLKPENPEFKPIEIPVDDAESFGIVGTFVGVLRGA